MSSPCSLCTLTTWSSQIHHLIHQDLTNRDLGALGHQGLDNVKLTLQMISKRIKSFLKIVSKDSPFFKQQYYRGIADGDIM